MNIGDLAGMPVSIDINLPTFDELQEAARQVLFHFDGDHEIGIQAGGFITSLMDVMAHADEDNKARLSLGFPALMVCVDAYKNLPDGPARLRAMATQTPTTQSSDGFSPKGN